MIHLIKLAVGVDTVEQMQASRRRMRKQQSDVLPRFITRNMPRRAAEIVSGGGSLYWVVKGLIRVRTPIVAIEPAESPHGRQCALIFDWALIPTWPMPHRPFQGWRYLPPERAPPDRAGHGDEGPPPEMAAELRALGLI